MYNKGEEKNNKVFDEYLGMRKSKYTILHERISDKDGIRLK